MKKLMKMVLSAWCLVLGAEAGAAAELPAGYTAVEYIESTPGGGQYIDTGYIPNVDTYIECVVELPDGQPRSEAAVFGARKGTRSRNAFAFFAKMYDNEDLTCFSLGHTETLGLAFYWGRQVGLRCDKSMAIWTISWDGRCLTPPTSVGTNLCVNTMFIFDVNSAEENAKLAGVCPAVMKLYSFKIKGDRYSPEYVRDFVPCVRDTDLEPGLYDHSSKTFYTNAGSGKFQIPPNALPVVTVGEHPHTTAVWTSDDGSVTNALKGTSFWVVKGAKVTVVFTPDPGYKLESGKFVHELGSVNADVTLTDAPQVALKDIDYLDADGRDKICQTFQVVTDKTPKLEDGRWYVVDGRVSRSALEVSGSAHLILIDGCELTVNGGLYVPRESAITIYGQRGGTGRLNANGQNGNAGIGGRYVMYDTDTHYCGSVTINGGMVNANGSSVDSDPGRWDYSFDAAGIGGCGIRSGGTVTVNGGRVIADSRSSGAGIGGGSILEGCQQEGGGGGTVTIRGGTVTASSRFASGIGAGAGAVGEPAAVTITGGSIDASIQNNVQKNSTGVPLRKVTLELPSITYEKVSFRGLGKYGLRDVVPVNKRVIFYLPDGQYEVVADFDLSGLDTRSQSYIFIVSGHDVVCRPQEFGLKVNNEDISRGFGKGWVYEGKTLSITGNDQIHQYTLSGVSSSGDVQVKVAASDCDVILSDAIIYTQGRPAFVVEPSLTDVSLQMKGGVSHLATTNATDGTSSPALEVESALTVDFASGADALRSAVYVFNFGEASAIGGSGPVSVAGGHLCAWSDERAVADTCSFDIAAESSDKVIAQAGESWGDMRFVSGQNPDEPIIEVAPSRTITIPAEIPHITSVVVSNDFEEVTGVRQDDTKVYRVMQEDNVIITYGIEDGCILQSENPQIFRSLREDVVIGSNRYPLPDVRAMLTLTLPSSVEGLLFAVYEDGQHVAGLLNSDGHLVYTVREGCAVQVVCRAADGWRIVGTRNTIDFDPIEQSEVLIAEDFPPVEVDKVSLAINRAFDVAGSGTTVKRTQVDGVAGHEVVLGGDIDGGLTLPADLGPIVLDLNGWTIRGTNGVHGTESTSGGDGGPAIRIAGSCGASEGTNTTLSVMNAAQSAVSGSGASAGIVGGNGGDGNPPGTGGLPVVDATGAAVKVTGDSGLLANGRDGVDLEDDDVDLPAGYSQVDYIESDGSGAYVDTKYVHTPSTRVECVVSVSARQPSSWAAIFGARRDSWRQNAFVFFSKALDDVNKSCYNRTGCEQRGGAFPGDLKTKVVCEGNVATWTAEGGASGSINASGGTVDDGVNTMFIFNLNTAGVNGKKPDTSPIAMKLYSFKIFEGGKLVRNFVPCARDADLEGGLYDLEETDPPKAFYGNAGGGVLDASESVSIRSVADEKPWYKIAVSYLPRGVEEETTYLLAFEVTANNETRGVTNRVTGLTHRTYTEEIDTSALFGQVRTDPEAKLRILLFATRPQMKLLGSTERRFALKPAPSDAFDLVLDANSATNSTRYVRSGLSAQYDGIENAGVGVHDDSATAWVDLSGNGRDAMTGEGLRSVVSNLLNSDSPYTIELFVRPHDGYLREAVGAAVSSDGETTRVYRNGLPAAAFDQPTSDDDILALRVYPRVLTEAEIWHNYRLDAARFAQRLEDGVVYSVTADTTFTGTGSDGVSAGDCAMSVADNAKACLCIDRGHTLTLVGGNGCLSQPGGAGLAVPASATLFIMGDGQLDATGGDGDGGGAGSGGENGTVGETSGVGGAGGDGGAGGAGASAGIGGVGGRGGRGGTGGAKVVDARKLGIFNQSGNPGGMGAKAAAGGDMGVVYALGEVKVNASAGSGASVGLEGTNGLDAVVFADDSAVSFAAAGGGGGGGGCGDVPTYGIGGGAGGGGGGGGGGSGGLDSRTAGESPVFLWGATGQCGFLNCGSETAGGRAAVICEGYQGGGAGGGGLAGSQGGDGALYAVETASVTNSGSRTPTATDGKCYELECTVSFDVAGGTGASATFTNYSWMALQSVNPPTRYGHEFLGYYLDGTMYYDADGKAIGGYLFRHDAVMVAKWRELETYEIRIPRVSGLDQPAVSNLTLGAALSPSPNGDQWIYRAYRGDSVRISLSACSPFQFAPSGQQTEWEIASLASDITFGMTAGYPLPTVAEFGTWSVGSGVVAYTNRAGRLTIVGTGAMDDFASAADVPWNLSAVTEVMIGEDVTKIGKYAFAGLANTVVLNRMTTTAAGSIFAAINGDVLPSGAISGAEFERIDIVDGKAYLGISVYTNSEVKVEGEGEGEGEGWGVATNGVIEVPAPGKQGFFILKSKPSVPSDAPYSPITILE